MIHRASSSRGLVTSALLNAAARSYRPLKALGTSDQVVPSSSSKPVLIPVLPSQEVDLGSKKKVAKTNTTTRKAAPKLAKEIIPPKPESPHAYKLINQAGVQMLSPQLHSQVFPGQSLAQPSIKAAWISKRHLKTHNLNTELASRLPETSFDLPVLQGQSIDEHFYNIGTHMATPWLKLATDFAGATKKELPPKPETIEHHPGWTRYNADGSFEHVTDLSPESAICFDVETLPAYSPFAVMACAVSKTAWYVWISPWLLGLDPSPGHLIPIGDPSRPRVIVGHNVSYDRARILEEYSIQGTKNRFLDTMSLHIACKGITSVQRPAWLSHRKKKREVHERQRESIEAVKALLAEAESQPELDKEHHDNLLALKADLEESLPALIDGSDYLDEESEDKRWEDVTSVNSLADIARLYCEVDMDKSTRDDFLTSTREEILDNIDEYLEYCCNDVATTLSVYQTVLPAFLESCPNPVSFAGVLTMGSAFLTVDQEWDNYIKSAEEKYHELEDDVRRTLLALAKEALAMYENDTEGKKPWEADEWLGQLDWTPRKVGKSRGVEPPEQPPPKTTPKWYTEITKERPGPTPDTERGTANLTVRSQVAPLLLRLRWMDYPLFHSRIHGWMYRVPKQDLEKIGTTSKPLEFFDEADGKLKKMCEDEQFYFFKLPHKDGDQANVGSPMSKMFLKYSQDGTLSSPGDAAKSALNMNAQCSYWISARDRVSKQVVMWDQQAKVNMGLPPPPPPPQLMPPPSSGPEIPEPEATPPPPRKYGMILPQVITMGTVTRRAIEKTWLTASNAKSNRIGSELKALVRAPEGYALVGADVDSEELWIASVMGDAQFGIHGATAIGWMTLEGTKAAGTDLHSKTASILGITRNHAKVFNYSRIYGAGINHAVLLLLQHNASMKEDTAKTLAKNLYASTKGKSTYSTAMFGRKFWYGGTESYLFNKLEQIATSDDPRTPALGCGVTSALSKKYLSKNSGEDYMTSRINWVVQSSGVDYLHMLIVAVDYLIQTYDIEARYLISIHDEIRYLAKEKDRYRLALALQIANLWTRCMFAYKLGFDNLPQGVAFFSAVDVDKYLRKEVDMTCITPSQPIALPPGESLDVHQILERTGGSLWAGGTSPNAGSKPELTLPHEQYTAPDVLAHREACDEFLEAQSLNDAYEIRMLAQVVRSREREREAELAARANIRAKSKAKRIQSQGRVA
ncbi:DNA-directed DNA polymerase gamma mip1 [Ceratobasidium sp. 423]|nr:DNA-directed DNA polymerase gamma mip1 [Ceratobasidium sp. 423]